MSSPTLPLNLDEFPRQIVLKRLTIFSLVFLLDRFANGQLLNASIGRFVNCFYCRAGVFMNKISFVLAEIANRVVQHYPLLCPGLLALVAIGVVLVARLAAESYRQC